METVSLKIVGIILLSAQTLFDFNKVTLVEFKKKTPNDNNNAPIINSF